MCCDILQIAGILLTGGHRPSSPVQSLIEGILETSLDSTGLDPSAPLVGAYSPAHFLLPVLLTKEDTFRAVQKLNKVKQQSVIIDH